MSLPITGYAVFVYFKDINRCHAPHFPDIESAEEFANDLRAMSDCDVAEPKYQMNNPAYMREVSRSFSDNIPEVVLNKRPFQA